MSYSPLAREDAQRRAAIISVYQSKAWADRVKRMSAKQVVAVYLRLKKQGKI